MTTSFRLLRSPAIEEEERRFATRHNDTSRLATKRTDERTLAAAREWPTDKNNYKWLFVVRDYPRCLVSVSSSSCEIAFVVVLSAAFRCARTSRAFIIINGCPVWTKRRRRAGRENEIFWELESVGTFARSACANVIKQQQVALLWSCLNQRPAPASVALWLEQTRAEKII